MSALHPQNFEVTAGDRKVLRVTVKDDNGNPVPLAGTQAVDWRLSRTQGSPEVLAKSLANGITIETDQAGDGEANAGRLDIVLTEADTLNLVDQYYHFCRLTDADGNPCAIFYGRGDVRV